jgi:NADH-quinone oxidoreductase subunit M
MQPITDNNWLLSVGTFLPLVGLVVMLIIPRTEEMLHKAVAIVVSAVTVAFGIATAVLFDYDRAGDLQFYVNVSWIPVLGSRYIMGLDGQSLPLYLLSMVTVLLVALYSVNHIPEPGNPKMFLGLMMILAVGMNGAFVAQDLILFFVFFEVVLLPMYFMIGVWGGENRQYASIKFFLFTLFGSAFILVGFIALHFLTGAETWGIVELTQRVADDPLSRTAGLLIFGGMALGFAVKVPMFPFHTWLPDAHTQAPTAGSVILAAILLKLGSYGFMRIAIPILPDAAREFAPWIGGLAVIGIIYGALCCLAQTDMKRLIAFSSVSHMGFVMLGIATLTPAGFNAALFGMVAHGLITGMLFFLAGSVKDRWHTLAIRDLGGIAKVTPRMGWIYGMVTMASLGLPGLAGFWGEFPAILSAYQPAEGLDTGLFRGYMIVAAIGTVFAAGYLLWLYQRVALGNPAGEVAHAHEPVHDIGTWEWVAWTPFLIGIVVFGLAPNLLFQVMDPAMKVALSAFGG